MKNTKHFRITIQRGHHILTFDTREFRGSCTVRREEIDSCKSTYHRDQRVKQLENPCLKEPWISFFNHKLAYWRTILDYPSIYYLFERASYLQYKKKTLCSSIY